MTNLTITKKDVAAVATLLREGEFDSADDAAKAVLAAAFELYEAKSKFVIAGQLYYSPEAGFVQPEDPRALKVCMGPYPSEATARNAQESLLYSNATGEEFRRWVLPIWHGTPSAWFRSRKQEREAAALEKRQPSGLPAHMKKEAA